MQSVNIAKMASGSSVQIETLATTFETIKQGIVETQRITEEQANKRIEDTNRLEAMKQEMKDKNFIGK